MEENNNNGNGNVMMSLTPAEAKIIENVRDKAEYKSGKWMNAAADYFMNHFNGRYQTSNGVASSGYYFRLTEIKLDKGRILEAFKNESKYIYSDADVPAKIITFYFHEPIQKMTEFYSFDVSHQIDIRYDINDLDIFALPKRYANKITKFPLDKNGTIAAALYSISKTYFLWRIT